MNSKYVKIGLLSAAWMIPSTLQGQVAGGINTYPPQNAGVSERGEALKQDPEIIKRYFPQMMGAAASSAQPKPAPETFSISFPGGSAAQFVEYLRKVSKNAPNIMLAPSMQDAEVPAFDLRNITVEDLFQALNSMQGGGKSGFWQMSGSDHPIWVLNPPKAAPVAPPFLMTVPVEKNNVPAEKRRTMVFPLAQHLATFSIDSVGNVGSQSAMGDEVSQGHQTSDSGRNERAVGDGDASAQGTGKKPDCPNKRVRPAVAKD
jgi:hypothetical protein